MVTVKLDCKKCLLVAYCGANKDGWWLSSEKELIQRGFQSVIHMQRHIMLWFFSKTRPINGQLTGMPWNPGSPLGPGGPGAPGQPGFPLSPFSPSIPGSPGGPIGPGGPNGRHKSYTCQVRGFLRLGVIGPWLSSLPHNCRQLHIQPHHIYGHSTVPNYM